MKQRMVVVLACLVAAALGGSLAAPQVRATHGANAWVSQPPDIYYDDGNVGIGTSMPGQRLHIADGNVLIEGGGETALIFKRDQTFTGGPSGTSANPIFELGRVIQAGDGDPEIRVLYSDDATPPRAVFEFDRKGIIASVKPDRGSHFEGFISPTDPQPVFRLNSYPKMRLEMGAGGANLVDVALQRDGPGVLSLLSGATERLRVDGSGVKVSSGYLQLATTRSVPPNVDCDEPGEVGRMQIHAEQSLIYVCARQGWGILPILVNNLALPVVQR